MITKGSRNDVRLEKHRRIRHHLAGTAACPRLAVFRSNKQMYVQFIDDSLGKTVLAASTMDKALGLTKTNDVAAAAALGEYAGKKAVEAGIKEVVFDRGGYLYTGKIKALADAAREAGLEF